MTDEIEKLFRGRSVQNSAYGMLRTSDSREQGMEIGLESESG